MTTTTENGSQLWKLKALLCFCRKPLSIFFEQTSASDFDILLRLCRCFQLFHVTSHPPRGLHKSLLRWASRNDVIPHSRYIPRNANQCIITNVLRFIILSTWIKCSAVRDTLQKTSACHCPFLRSHYTFACNSQWCALEPRKNLEMSLIFLTLLAAGSPIKIPTSCWSAVLLRSTVKSRKATKPSLGRCCSRLTRTCCNSCHLEPPLPSRWHVPPECDTLPSGERVSNACDYDVIAFASTRRAYCDGHLTFGFFRRWLSSFVCAWDIKLQLNKLPLSIESYAG